MPVTQCACLDGRPGQLPAMITFCNVFLFFCIYGEGITARAIALRCCSDCSAGFWSAWGNTVSSFSFRTQSSKGQCSPQICECVYMWIKTNTGEHQRLRVYFTFLAIVCWVFLLSWITGKKTMLSYQSLTARYVTAFITGFGITVEKFAKIDTGRKL